jgi:hypothetical protein
MQIIEAVQAPFDLSELEKSIRASSNFSFACPFYRYENANPASPRGARAFLEAIIATPELHAVLRHTFAAYDGATFEIHPLEPHAVFEPADGRMENLLASASRDHAGAYSRILRDATASERSEIATLFGALGESRVLELVGREHPGCPTCGYRSHLFSNWFHGVAWDWCFLVVWPTANVAALVCVTDTD